MSAIPEATPRPQEGAVSWNINTACNYRCSYCTQRFVDDRGRWARDTSRFVEAFGRLPGRWEIKISGGEPFVHPGFLEIVAGLASSGHRVSVVTNFSAKRERLAAFVDAAAGRVGVFSASLHLEYVTDLDTFIEKASWMQGQLVDAADPSLPAPSLNVTCVATRDNLPRLRELLDRFDGAGVRFKVQPEKQDRDVIDYEPAELRQLRALGGHNRTGEIANAFRGRPCWSGAAYFIVDDRGNAFRCYPARRFRLEAMGNLLDDTFTLADAATPCRYRYCNCTVPILRGMMPREEL